LIGGSSPGAFRRVARFGDGWHATAATPAALVEGQAAIGRHWHEFQRAGTPLWTLRIPLLVEGVHRPAVDMRWLAGRYAIRGRVDQVIEQLLEYQRLGVSHVALDVSYTSYPAILDTVELITEQVKPRVSEPTRTGQETIA
ncbi:MAG TPA: hypothetical protein VMG58_16075, partial [Candidatus Sulfotelmatobacter sp.]|nr:hypothetical protein [Candidatus Sulfotelmatobacter sp.]